MDAYLRDTSPRPGNRLRKIERSALTYLYRTACKTSPFSTFTGIGLGTFTGGPSDGGAALRTGEDWVSHVRLNVVALARLTELITADPAAARTCRWSSPGLGRDADRIRYVRHVMTAGDDSAAVTFDAVRDRLSTCAAAAPWNGSWNGSAPRTRRCATGTWWPGWRPGTTPDARSANGTRRPSWTSAWCRCRCSARTCTVRTRSAPTRTPCVPSGCPGPTGWPACWTARPTASPATPGLASGNAVRC
ncbi:lantibiotic dehydratase [Streptomyces sp. INA 01156]